MKIKQIYLVGILFAVCAGSPTRAAEPQAGALQEPQAQILTANIDSSYQDGKPKNTFVITGKSKIGIKKADIISEGEDDSSFTVYLTTDNFPAEVGSTLVVKVKDKVFVPYAYGGDSKTYWSLDLRHVDRASAEILNPGPLPKAPKDSFTVGYTPFGASYPVKGPVEVGITLANIGKVPLTIFWGTTGGGNYLCRDTQLSFTATLDGVAVPANPKPLPDGFIMSPFIAKPNSDLKRGEDLRQWLQFQKAGTYIIQANYTVEIMNPEKGALPSKWNVTYHNQFSVKIGN